MSIETKTIPFLLKGNFNYMEIAGLDWVYLHQLRPEKVKERVANGTVEFWKTNFDGNYLELYDLPICEDWIEGQLYELQQRTSGPVWVLIDSI